MATLHAPRPTPRHEVVKAALRNNSPDPEIFLVTAFRRAIGVTPVLLFLSLAAVLLGSFMFDLTGPELVIGAAVPLISLFVTTRLILLFVVYQTPRRKPAHTIPLLGFVSVFLLLIAMVAVATFSMSGIMFSLLGVPDAAFNAWIAVAGFGVLGLLSLLGAVAVVMHVELGPLIDFAKLAKLFRCSLKKAFKQTIECFLYLPTALSNPFHA